jgi:hypothetical protein
MLHKCANSDCSIVFRSLSCGKLFQIESQPAPPPGRPALRRFRPRRIERYWLCDRCSAMLTLAPDVGGGIVTVPLPALLRRQAIAAQA